MKKLALSIVLVGFTSMAFAQQKSQGEFRGEGQRPKMQERMQQGGDRKIEEMKKLLNLTEDQVAKIKQIEENRKSEMKSQFSKNSGMKQPPKMEDMKATEQKMNEELKSILTSEQWAKWETSMKERKNFHPGNPKGERPVKATAK